MNAFEEHREELEKYEQMFGKERGRLAKCWNGCDGGHEERKGRIEEVKEYKSLRVEEFKRRGGRVDTRFAGNGSGLEEGVGVAFVADGGGGAVAGVDDGVVGEMKEFGF
jgi:hypothetical protein